MCRRYYGQSLKTGGGSEQPIDEILHTWYFPDKTDGFFIEAGANDGVFLSTCKTFEDVGWGGVNIEPNKTLFEKLCKNRPTSINLNIALSDCEGEVEFEEIEFENGCFSRVKDPKRNEDVDRRFNLTVLRTYTIPSKPYSQVITELSIPHVDLFVLDVEGYEPEVIQGMEGCHMPDVFCIEWVHCGLERLKELLQGRYELNFLDTLNAVFLRK
jgi:FkbM family methyltransferase